jgi:multiple sugar transport system substrate-binding protein
MSKHIFLLLVIVLLMPSMAGCSHIAAGNPKNPVTLTLWHNYGGQMKELMDEMIDQFNETEGAKKGIVISVTSISGSAALHEKLVMAANNDPGAPSLPDITTAYPKTALILAKKGLLAELEAYFTPEELQSYIPQFLAEGKIYDDKLYVFPTAKSTEVLFVNTTLFNRFARDTGASIHDLYTFEGLFRTAEMYYDWTDRQTPDVEKDGKAFYMPDSLFNFALMGYHQLGESFVSEKGVSAESPVLSRIWDSYFKSAVLGHTAVFDGYATDLAKTGDIVCSTGSTAGVVFFSPTVTYADNTTEPAELAILPYPILEGGKKTAVQRGSGMCVIKSDKAREALAADFIKWFTSPEHNLHFVSSTGYLPVTEQAFGEIMIKEIESSRNENIKKLLQVSRQMYREYDFAIPPLFDGLDEIQNRFERVLKKLAAESKEEYQKLVSSGVSPDRAYQAVSDTAREEFIRIFSDKK